MISELWDQLFYYLDALWRRRWLALAVAICVATAGWVYVAQMPSQYTSSAQVYVDTESVLGPLLQGMTIEGDTDQRIAVMRQTLKSRSNLEEVVRRSDMDLQATSPEQMSGLVSRVAAGLTIQGNPQNIYTIFYTGRDPQIARNVVEATTTIFVENNLGEKRADLGEAQDFISRQVQRYENRLQEAENELAEFKRQNADTLPGNSSYGERLEQVKGELANLKGELQDARARVELLRRELDQTPEMLTQQGGGMGPPSNIDSRIMELRAQLEQLKSRYTSKHPDVVTAQRRLESLLQEKESATSAAANGDGPSADASAGPAGAEGGGGGVRIPNPTYSDLRLQLVEARSRVESLQQRVARTRDKLNTLQQKRDEVFKVEAKLKELQRDYNVVQNRYQTMLSRLETAELSEQRNEQADNVRFRMIETPQVPSAPSGPNRPVFLAGAFVLSLGAGSGLALLLGLLKTSYGSVQHIRRDYDIPVLGTLSRQPGPGEAKWRSLDRAAFISVAGMFVASFVALVAIERAYGLGNLDQGIVGGFSFDSAMDVVRGWTGRS